MIILHIHDERRRASTSRQLDKSHAVLSVALDGAADLDVARFQHCLIEIDLSSLRTVLRVQRLVDRLKYGGARILACKAGDEHDKVQARALGATHIVDRPVTDAALLRTLIGRLPDTTPQPASAIAGGVALDTAFASLTSSQPLSLQQMSSVAAGISDDIADLGIESWLSSIRAHHAGTYQHCLIVTGLANSFAQALRLPETDIRKLTVAALLHDIGKAKIDASILDKNGPLSVDERRIIEMHPVWGADHLADQEGMLPEILDGVRHHHEMLDGTGYPDRLKGRQISDLTRLLTIADIFGALVERRSYKPPMTGEAAFGVIREMADAGKLEKALVKAFRLVTKQIKDQPAHLSA